MKNKGFTLVELLAVILVMVIIATLVVTSAFSIVNNNKKEQYGVLLSEVEQAVKLYLNDNYENYVVGREYKYLSVKFLDDNNSAVLYVKLDDLVEAGLIKASSLIDPRDNSNILKDGVDEYVEVKYANGDLVISDEFVTEYSYPNEKLGYNENNGTYEIKTSNNYVNLNNQIWRIIRVNKDGSIRLFLDDSNGIGSSVFGVKGEYASSYVLTNMQYWYIYDVYSGAKNLIREASLSLITNTEYASLNQNIINKGIQFWMINSNGNGVLSDNADSELTDAYNTTESIIRPIIELKPNAIYVSGNGSQSNPYTVR